MPRASKHAGLICLILTLVVVAGAVCGYFLERPVILAFALLPAAFYELYRTEGRSTRICSVLLAVLLIAEIVVVLGSISFDLPAYLRDAGVSTSLPQGLLTLRNALAALAALVCIPLFANSRGVYTRWLAVDGFVGSVALLYLLAPEEIAALLR